MFRSLTATALLVLSVTAVRADDWTRDSVAVTYGDLNLSKPADAKVLAERLEAAATLACQKANSDLDWNAMPLNQDMRHCIDSAITVAMSRIEKSLDRSVRANLASANP